MKLITLMLLMFSVTTSFSQKHSDKIIHAYGQLAFDAYQVNNPGMLIEMDNYIDFGFEVKTSTSEKYLTVPVLSEIPLRLKTVTSVSIDTFLNDYNSSSFNPLIYKFFPKKFIQVYRLEGTDKIVIISNHSTILSNK